MNNPEIETNHRRPQPVKELVDLLSAIEFSEECAAVVAGEYWGVYVHPWPREDGTGNFDARVTIVPRVPEAGSFADTGLTLCPHRENVYLLFQSKPDESQGIWFRGLHPDVYGISVGRAAPVTNGKRRIIERLDLAALTQLNANAASPWRCFQLADRRVTALLEGRNPSKPRLLVYTHSAELAGSTVHFTFGDQSGTILLEASKTKGKWAGSIALSADLKTLGRFIPDFELL